jgi:phosphoglycerate dehydrogenase-like enzyme
MTAGVVGLGAVGREVARTLRAVGVRVVGVRRTPVDEPAALHVDEATTPDRLHELLPRCDALVLIAPHTPETEGLIGARELAALPAAPSWSTSPAAR